jgi:signal transduction histidine kinase
VDRLSSPIRWLRDHPVAADWLLVLGLGTVLVLATSVGSDGDGHTQTPGLGTFLIIGAGVVPLAWRRRRPVAAVLAVALVEVAVTAVGFPGEILAFSCLIGVYSLAAHAERRTALLGLACTPVLIGVAMWLDRDRVGGWGDVLWNLVIFLTAWVLGDNLQARRSRTAALEERAARLEREQADAAARAVQEERARIARELHDVVAHSMSVMVVQAGAARRSIDRDREGAKEAMVAIEQTGRQALDEMRRLLGVLRRDGDESLARAPQPTVRHLDALVRQVREAGLEVDLEVVGEPRDLAAGLDLSAYRIVQEALTNVLKHAGRAAATVRLTYGERHLEIEVRDDGRGLAAALVGPAVGGSGGNGLVGMRERVALYGGSLVAGPCPGGGYEVRATLPLQQP